MSTFCATSVSLLLTWLSVSLYFSQATAYQYKYLSYTEIHTGLLSLARQNSDILRVQSATRHFPSFQTPGVCRLDPSLEQTGPCDTLIAELGVLAAHPNIPTVLILGPWHGDDRIAGTAVYHLITTLVTRARSDRWLNRLLTTRRILAVPLPNPLAYDRGVRLYDSRQRNRSDKDTGNTTLLSDPEHDFPTPQRQYGTISDSHPCLQSSTAKLIDLLFADNTFVVALRVHEPADGVDHITFSPLAASGTSTSAIGPLCKQNATDCIHPSVPASRWHAQWRQKLAGDGHAFQEIAGRMAAFAGPAIAHSQNFLIGPTYPTATRPPVYNKIGPQLPHLDNAVPNNELRDNNSLWVDYAYAMSSQFRPKSDMCAGRGQKSTNTSHRAAAFDIGISRDSARDGLGDTADLYMHSSKGNAVTRVLRSLLVGIDFALPYVFFMRSDDLSGTGIRGGIAHVRWSVGGAVQVDCTYLTCRLGNGDEWTSNVQSGGSMWTQSFDDAQGLSFHFLDRLTRAPYDFKESLPLYNRLSAQERAEGTTLYVRADAIVDSAWFPAKDVTKAQSHLVQLRGNESWFAKDSQQTLRGKHLFSTRTVEIEVHPVSGLSALSMYAYEYLLLGFVAWIGPPLVVLMCVRRRSRSYIPPSIRKGFRRTFRAISLAQVDVAQPRRRGRLTRTHSAGTILGINFNSSDGIRLKALAEP